MDFIKYPITQSLIKKFLYKGEELNFCPKQIYHTEWLRDIPRYETDSMMAGRFFETLCLGSSADGQMVTDLERKGLTKKQIMQNERDIMAGAAPTHIAKKKIGQIRIEEQALAFKQLCVKYQITVMPGINTQIPIKIKWEQDPTVILEMTLDIFPTSVMGRKETHLAVIDLKLTGNIHNTFGEYCYGDPEHLDKIQGWMYHYGIRNIDFELNPHMVELMTTKVQELIKTNDVKFLMWVFDYKKEELENKFIEVSWAGIAKAELMQSIKKTIAIIEENENLGWPTKPLFEFCKNCPLKECPDRTIVETI